MRTGVYSPGLANSELGVMGHPNILRALLDFDVVPRVADRLLPHASGEGLGV